MPALEGKLAGGVLTLPKELQDLEDSGFKYEARAEVSETEKEILQESISRIRKRMQAQKWYSEQPQEAKEMIDVLLSNTGAYAG